MSEPRREDALPFVKDLMSLHDGIRDYFAATGVSPMPGSKAEKELAEFPKSGLVKTAYSQGGLLLNSASDHLSAFAKSMTGTIETIAPWTLVRGVVEASTMSIWLLDASIDVKERVARSYAYRYDGIEE